MFHMQVKMSAFILATPVVIYKCSSFSFTNDTYQPWLIIKYFMLWVFLKHIWTNCLIVF